jgi:hypothetical protein
MSKKQISISELAQRIVLEKKFNKMIAEIASAMKASTRMLNEAGLPSGIDQAILGASKKLDAAGEDVASDDVQAALMMAALEKGGDPSKVSPEEVEAAMPTVQERRQARQPLNESGGIVLQVVETISVVLGNAALIEAICKVIEKVTGKKTDPSKFTQTMNKWSGRIKSVTGWPMEKLGQAIEWIIRKLGGGEAAQKIGKYSVKLVVVVTLFCIGAMFFPIAGASVFGIIVSVTAMIGKGFEIGMLIKGLFNAIKDAVSKGATKAVANVSANNPEMGMA